MTFASHGVFEELNNDFLMEINGGANWDKVMTGVGLVGAAVVAVASAPVSVPLVAGAAAISIAGGYFIGSGLRD